ncbi:MAG: helix-turn-helix domain-containing protein [Ruminococcus sp.]|nr:helix-turn-helix domain-containing protein [Ruminococcus sp.]MCM1381116.1 helix-turn-helix domain-containing protein [Muribaculaceae bacterium]MCM1479968.1 helix-turn-helix domain-containing protein [Muribaculaceae bacterium]
MTAIERGKRIKEARILKKMTQSEVVGDFITRNMLSQIESGAATPSVKTLEYLAETLDIPIGELLPGGEESQREQNVPAERLVRAKGLFAENLCVEAMEEIGSEADWGGLSDEFSAVKARCLLKLAEQLAEEDTVKAVEYAKEAAKLAETGFYANLALKAEALKLVSVLAEKLAKYYSQLITVEK